MKRCRTRTFFIVIVCGLLSLSLGGPRGFSAYETEEDGTTTSSSDSSSSSRRQKMKPEEAGTSKEEKILKTLNEVLANQATILQRLDTVMFRFNEIMEELRIIKVRATIRGS